MAIKEFFYATPGRRVENCILTKNLGDSNKDKSMYLGRRGSGGELIMHIVNPGFYVELTEHARDLRAIGEEKNEPEFRRNLAELLDLKLVPVERLSVTRDAEGRTVRPGDLAYAAL